MTKTETQEKLFEEIGRVAGEVGSAYSNNPKVQAEILLNLSLAYRYAAGGNQPGSVTVEK